MATFIPWRRFSGPGRGIAISLVLAFVVTGVAFVDELAGLDALRAGDTAQINLRTSAIAAVPGSDTQLVGVGETVTARQAVDLQAAQQKRPPLLYRALGAGLGFFLLFAVLLTAVRYGYRGRLLRVQLTVAGVVLVTAAMFKAWCLLSPLPPMAFPAVAAPLLVAAYVDRQAGLAVAIGLGVCLGVLAGLDFALLGIVALSGLAGAFAWKPPRKLRNLLIAGASAGVVGALGLLATQLPFASSISESLALAEFWRSGWFSVLLAGFAGGAVAALFRPAMLAALDELSPQKLMEYADLEHPLLKQIAKESPGTWQHSLAMANMAEISANAIGANALQARVGAYYHDLGKSFQAKYFIENLRAGEPSPHDSLEPQVSADAIFAHVTEGVRLGRERGLPEAIIDFMHMHHGDGIVEYFWGKCLEQGNPLGLSLDDFRYPGWKPQSRETGILAIVDAVEAAGRTVRQPDEKKISNLIQRIVYGKLSQGQLDESGLSLRDLGTLSNTLVEILLHAYHDRIEYPWQKEKEERTEPGAKAPAAAQTPAARSVTRVHRDPLWDSAVPHSPDVDVGDIAARMLGDGDAYPRGASADDDAAHRAETVGRDTGRVVTAAVPPHAMVPPRRRPSTWHESDRMPPPDGDPTVPPRRK